ncbi:hypothetical protein PR048_014150 [Dryococelus australis]|uniref:Uncharacterized protein n=1 Tax=Dryococelus australis TaxID=614101 RepID=A0ABQ9HDE8_9NEOP|nr:hypothetical protein PR048_014150 [Dryococelus australis]
MGSVVEESKMHEIKDPSTPGLKYIDRCSLLPCPHDDNYKNFDHHDFSEEEGVSFYSENSQSIDEATEEVEQQSAKGFAEEVIKLLEEKNLYLKNCRGQGYDGDAVMSGLIEMSDSFGELVSEASDICKRWGISQSFPKSMTMKGIKGVVNTYQVIQPEFLVNASEKDVHDKAIDFVIWYPDDVSPTFLSQICSAKTSFKSKLEKIISVKQFADWEPRAVRLRALSRQAMGRLINCLPPSLEKFLARALPHSSGPRF